MKINSIDLIKSIIKFIILFILIYILIYIIFSKDNFNNQFNNQINKHYLFYSLLISSIILLFLSYYKYEFFDENINSNKKLTENITEDITDNYNVEASNDDDNDDEKTEKIEIEEETIGDIDDETKDNGINIDKNNDKNKTFITKELNDNDKTLIAEYEDTINKMETNPAYKSNDNIITDENVYDQYGGGLNANSLYVPRDYKLSDPLDAQYYQIPPQYWVGGSFGMVQPPVCSPANGRCKISNICTSGYPSNSVEVNYVPLKNYFEATKILGPDGINVKYIEDKLNTAH